MTPNEYLQRHDRVGQYIHWKMCQHYIIHHMLRTGTNISHRKLHKQEVQQYFKGLLYSYRQNNTSK